MFIQLQPVPIDNLVLVGRQGLWQAGPLLATIAGRSVRGTASGGSPPFARKALLAPSLIGEGGDIRQDYGLA